MTDREMDAKIGALIGANPEVRWRCYNTDETAYMIEFESKHEADAWLAEKSANYPEYFADQHIGKVEIWPRYSSSIADAWMVVEALMAMGWTPTLAIRQFEKHPEDRFIFHGVRLFGTEPGKQRIGSFSARADTAPSAICEAALKAIEGSAK